MEVIPAIDLMESKVVRLRQGSATNRVEYWSKMRPIEVASMWIDEGANTLHIVDLDRAFAKGNNLQQIKQILETIQSSIQVGGGLRKLDDIIEVLEYPQAKVIIGTLAIQKRAALKWLLDNYGPEQIIIALDYRNGCVVKKGWTETTKIQVENAIETFQEMGVGRFLLTSVDRDGMLNGPDFETLHKISNTYGIILTAAGGIGTLEDIQHLKQSGVSASIVGMALYEGLFSLQDALAIARRES